MSTIAIVDDDPAVRDSLQFLLETHGFTVLLFESGDGFLNAGETRFDAILLDVRMPGRDGLSVLEAIRQTGSSIPIIIMSGHADVAMAVRALKSGAQDFVEKPFEARELLDAIGRVLANRREYLKRQIDEQTMERRLNSLTPREREVAEQLAKGLSNKETARELNISPRTVETHRAHILSKLDVRSVSQIVRLMMKSR